VWILNKTIYIKRLNGDSVGFLWQLVALKLLSVKYFLQLS